MEAILKIHSADNIITDFNYNGGNLFELSSKLMEIKAVKLSIPAEKSQDGTLIRKNVSTMKGLTLFLDADLKWIKSKGGAGGGDYTEKYSVLLNPDNGAIAGVIVSEIQAKVNELNKFVRSIKGSDTKEGIGHFYADWK